MANIFTQFFKQVAKDPEQMRARIRQDMLRRESEIGKLVFGPIPSGRTREFFRLDHKTWIWQESWQEGSRRRYKDTKYIIRDRDVVKSVNGSPYEKVPFDEVKNLRLAVKTYTQRVKEQIYNPLLQKQP